MADFSASIIVMRPLQLVVKSLFLQMGQTPPSTSTLHSLHAFFMSDHLFLVFFLAAASFSLGAS